MRCYAMGRATSGGALAQEPPRATRTQPEHIRTGISPKIQFFFDKIVLSRGIGSTWFCGLKCVCGVFRRCQWGPIEDYYTIVCEKN